MICKVCDTELEWVDYFGKVEGWDKTLNLPKIRRDGDIYQCPNCQDYYYSFDDVNLFDGYPC